MKSHCASTTELNRSAPEGACDARTMASVRRSCVDRVSQMIEHLILAVVVLMALLGNYATHSLLMSEVLIL